MASGGVQTTVLYALKRDAKAVKVALEAHNAIDKRFRMTKAAPDADVFSSAAASDDAASASPAPLTAADCIAIPVKDVSKSGEWETLVVGHGVQLCPLSSALLGNHRHETFVEGSGGARRDDGAATLTTIQRALVDAIGRACQISAEAGQQEQSDALDSRIRALHTDVLPRKLERIGDDRTLVVPRRAMSLENDAFRSLIEDFVARPGRINGFNGDDEKLSAAGSTERPLEEVLMFLWENLARVHDSHRVVRRGDLDPESPIRESGHRILWPPFIDNGVPNQTGPGSPGWITVTEQGIKQSYDLRRVMFSRGNISEKIRFGKLVQEGEVVLDMYAGIGYFTLPALVHGKAGHVYACEWNAHAIAALRHNLLANGVDERATVLEGDGRDSAAKEPIVGAVDRVSLGLLPSSEGGWPTAVRALRSDTGGWLHIHGNVPQSERNSWACWLCAQILALLDKHGRASWVVVCSHIERVKSFAPKVDHLVADVHCGPPLVSIDMGACRAGVVWSDGSFYPCPLDTTPPSCALSPDGILHQEWMMQ